MVKKECTIKYEFYSTRKKKSAGYAKCRDIQLFVHEVKKKAVTQMSLIKV